MNKELLAKVADTIEETQRFNLTFLAWNEDTSEEVSTQRLNECGTVGCVAGWTLYLTNKRGSMYYAGHLLNLEPRQADRLFVGGPGSIWNDVAEKEHWPEFEVATKYLPWDAVTPERAVSVLRRIISGELTL